MAPFEHRVCVGVRRARRCVRRRRFGWPTHSMERRGGHRFASFERRRPTTAYKAGTRPIMEAGSVTVRLADGGGSPAFYTVSSGEHSVLRRFRHFEALHASLCLLQASGADAA
eukprot:2027967-Prymnesium_polylepis.1